MLVKTYNSERKSGLQSEHLCYIISQGFNLTNAEEYETIVKDPKFKCRHCKRAARKAENLCEPERF